MIAPLATLAFELAGYAALWALLTTIGQYERRIRAALRRPPRP